MFGIANYHERPEGVDGIDINIIICQCGYVSGHAQTNVCRWSLI